MSTVTPESEPTLVRDALAAFTRKPSQFLRKDHHRRHVVAIGKDKVVVDIATSPKA